jgi:Pyruvate/2-oxoacid:ferredoxin oxidoreductase gamma subunit
MNTNAVNQAAETVSVYTESEKNSKVSGKTIGEPKLSDKAKEYYEKLKKKFSTMDFILVSKDMKETAKANAGQYANANKMGVLFHIVSCLLLIIHENLHSSQPVFPVV